MHRRTRLNDVLCFSGFILVVVWMNLSRFHDLQYSDSLLLPLTSLQAWTPFYWDQNRFGMLLPLLALPVQQPLANLLFQSGVAIAAGWLALWLSIRYVLRAEAGEVPFICGSVLILVALPLTQRFEIFGLSQPYGTSSALTLAGLVLLDGNAQGTMLSGRLWRLSAAGFLMSLGAYVNVGAIIMFGPLVIARALFEQSTHRGRRWIPHPSKAALALALLVAALCGITAAAGWVDRPAAPQHDGLTIPETQFGLLPVDQWPSAWLRFLVTVHRRLTNESNWEPIVGVVLCVGLLSLLSGRVRRECGPRLRAGAALLVAGTVCFLATAVSDHVSFNHSQIRYAVPALILVTMGTGLLGSLGFLLIESHQRRLPPLVSPVVILCVVALMYGRPGIDVVRQSLGRESGEAARALVDARVDFFAGDYWAVWPAVFNALDIAAVRGQSSEIRGLSLRSSPSLSVRPPRPGHWYRVGVTPGDAQALPFMRQWLPPFRVLEERKVGPLNILVVQIDGR